MIDDTTHTDDVPPEAMKEIVARARRGSARGDATAPAADKKAKIPRSVKVSEELDLRIGLRAAELGMSKSAYLVWLAEQDLKNAYSDQTEMVSLQDARDIAIRAVDEALGRLSHRPGHAA